MAYLVSTDFTATTNGSTFTWTDSQLSMTRANTNFGAIAITNVGKTTNYIIAQCNLDWTGAGGSEDIVGFGIGSNTPSGYVYDTAYYAKITSRSDIGSEYRLWAGAATYNSYSNSTTGITKGKDVKIVYNTSNNEIKFYYWNGSTWVQMGTTQTYNIKNSGTVYLSLFYDNIQTTVSPAVFDKIYFDSYTADYTTQYPPTGTAYTLALAYNAFVLTGYASTLTKALTMLLGYNSFSLTGIAVTLKRALQMLITYGTYALTGFDVELSNLKKILIDVGNFAVTGYDATLRVCRCLKADVGNFILTGVNVILKSTAWGNDSKPSASIWTEDTKPSNSWTNDTKI